MSLYDLVCGAIWFVLVGFLTYVWVRFLQFVGQKLHLSGFLFDFLVFPGSLMLAAVALIIPIVFLTTCMDRPPASPYSEPPLDLETPHEEPSPEIGS
jgi:hypothetical protein